MSSSFVCLVSMPLGLSRAANPNRCHFRRLNQLLAHWHKVEFHVERFRSGCTKRATGQDGSAFLDAGKALDCAGDLFRIISPG